MASKMKPPADWHSRPRAERIANLMYPGLADEATKKTMLEIAKSEGKDDQLQRRMQADSGQHRNWWQPMPNPTSGPVVLSKYENVPGLKRK